MECKNIDQLRILFYTFLIQNMPFLHSFRKKYTPLNHIEIYQQKLLDNYKYLQIKSGKMVAPVLKSNAYGHGLLETAKILDNTHAPFICVDSIYEAYALQKANIKTPILIMGYVAEQNLRIKKLPFMLAVYSAEMVHAIATYQPQALVHIFVDTGMHREGIIISDLAAIVQQAKHSRLHIVGIMSHFASADKPNHPTTRKQVSLFQKARQLVAAEGIIPTWYHIAASNGILFADNYPEDLANIVRAGISLYGIDHKDRNRKLKPILSLMSTIVQIKEIEKGESIGYDFTFKALKNMRIAILPIGYNDGLDVRLTNSGMVKIHNQYCKIVGKVSMNITTVDISKVKNVKVGDKVTVYSANANAENSIDKMASVTGIMPYELLIHLHPSTRREIH